MMKKIVVVYCSILLVATAALTGSVALDAGGVIKLPRPAFAGLVATPLSPNPGGTAQPWWYSQSIAGNRFVGGAGISPSAQFPEIQLVNPNASGKTVIVDQITVATTVAATVDFRQFATALGTAQGQGNLLMGGAAPVASIKSALVASRDGTDLSNSAGPVLGASQNITLINVGVTIPANNGFLVTSQATITGVWTVQYIWQEQ